MENLPEHYEAFRVTNKMKNRNSLTFLLMLTTLFLGLLMVSCDDEVVEPREDDLLCCRSFLQIAVGGIGVGVQQEYFFVETEEECTNYRTTYTSNDTAYIYINSTRMNLDLCR